MNPDIRYPATIHEMYMSFWRNRQLIVQLTKREVIGRYRGSVFGIAWSFFNPLLMLIVYSFIFSVVFKSRWDSSTNETNSEYALVLFIGLIMYTIFAECVNRAPTLIVNNANYVKKIVFPLEVLPWVALGATLFHASISLAVWGMFYILLYFSFPWSIIYIPILVLPLILITIGVSWFLSAVGVFLRDVGQTTSIVTSVLLFMSPIFYPVSALPESFQILVFINPLTFVIEQTREVLIWGNSPEWVSLGLYYLFSVFVAMLGLFWFQKTRTGFADVL